MNKIQEASEAQVEPFIAQFKKISEPIPVTFHEDTKCFEFKGHATMGDGTSGTLCGMFKLSSERNMNSQTMQWDYMDHIKWESD